MTFGISSLTTYCEASTYPGDPGCMRSLPDCVSNSGSQPTSSSAPEQMSRSALRARAMRLGRASIRCGSCSPVVAEYTDTLSPPSSSASAPHSGSHARTLCIAAAGSAATVTDSAARKVRIVFMSSAMRRLRILAMMKGILPCSEFLSGKVQQACQLQRRDLVQQPLCAPVFLWTLQSLVFTPYLPTEFTLHEL